MASSSKGKATALGWSEVVGEYRRYRLWQQCIPIHPGGSKAPYGSGRTGRDQKAMTGATDWYVRDYGEKFGGAAMRRAAIGLVLPKGVAGLDFDCYDGKDGAKTRLAWVRQFGPLPESASIRARGDGSGIWLYRLPDGMDGSALRSDLGSKSHVDVLRWCHRYAVAPPGLHHATGRPREWWDRDGLPTAWPWIPRLADLAPLPDVWAAALAKPVRPPSPRKAEVHDSVGARLLVPHIRRVIQAGEGVRNKRLYEAALFAVREGVSAALVKQVLTEVGEQVGLEPEEIAKTVASGIKAGA